MPQSIRDPAAGSSRVTTERGGTAARIARAVVALLCLTASAAEPPRLVEAPLPGRGLLRWQRGGEPVLLVRVERGDGWLTLARRWAGGAAAASGLRAANPELGDPRLGRPVVVPVALLAGPLRLEAVARLFPADERVAEGWRHWVMDPFGGGEESWQWLARTFAGDAAAAAAIRRANPAEPAAGPRRGSRVVVPAGLLEPVFRDRPVRSTPTPTATPTASPRPSPSPTPVARATAVAAIAPSPPPLEERGVLSFGSDRAGGYAVYRLRAGEALYSAVVVRFTGQLDAEQVNATAAAIARRSDIADVTSIPIGYPIKIPLDLLLPEYLPPDDPRRKTWESERAELASFLEVVRAADLKGVHVILDAGHGGTDTGAVVGGVWESTYAYDLACRVKANLERHTRATVWMTRKDGVTGFAVPDRDRLEQHRNQFLLTRPTYDLSDSVIGVHLRWYLTNDIILNRLGADVPRSKTVFVSIHADSLHPSVRGAMVYVPSRYMRPPTYTVRHPGIRRFEEYRNHPTISLGPEFKARVEASSRHLAAQLIARLDANDLETHPYQPIRDRILRGRRSFVPAVLRYTAAQNAVLVEACNMANDQDRALLQSRAWREHFARALVEGISAAYDGAQ